MHQTRRHPPQLVIGMTAVMLVLCGPAFAQEEQPIVEEPNKRLARDIVTRLDNLPETRPNWFRANIRTAKKRGFEFSHSIRTKNRDTDVVFSVQGPMIRKKTAGLKIEIRF